MAGQQVRVFFNFRSPYCYLASRSLFAVLEDAGAQLLWRPLGGWDGRSSPSVAPKRVKVARQDVARWCRRLGLPFQPPPPTTDPTSAALLSLVAERHGQLRPFVEAVMTEEWGKGQDIGDPEVLLGVSNRLGIAKSDFELALTDDSLRARLEEHWSEAQSLGVFGVPTFVVDGEGENAIFWGSDRIGFLSEHLHERAPAGAISPSKTGEPG